MSISEIKKKNTSSEIDITLHFSDLWKGFIKFWIICVVLAVVFGGFMFYKSYTNYIPSYQASATFTVHTENATLSGDGGLSAYSFYYDRGTADQLASVFPYVLQSNILQKQVCHDLGVNRMPASVSATCVTGTNMVTLTTSGSDPQQTYDVLLSVIDNYPYLTEYIIGRTQMVMISDPVVPTEPTNSMYWMESTAKGAIIGFIIGALWILIYALLRKTIRTKDDIPKALNQTCIGVLPKVKFKKYKKNPNTNVLISNPLVGNAFMEAIRLLRDSVQSKLEENEKVVMITSTAPGEGKSSTTLNLAGIFAKNNKKVLVIDGDLRNSGIQKILSGEIASENSASQNERFYTIEKVDSLNIDLLTFNTLFHRLWKIMRTANLKEVVDSLRDEYDYIFIDTPPFGTISDAAIIAGASDAVLYLIKQDTVLVPSIRESINTLLSTDTKIIGCFLNGADTGISGYGSYYSYAYEGYNDYSYGYGYGYGYGKYGKESRHRHHRKSRSKKEVR